jgi:hypothetical protein
LKDVAEANNCVATVEIIDSGGAGSLAGEPVA